MLSLTHFHELGAIEEAFLSEMYTKQMVAKSSRPIVISFRLLWGKVKPEDDGNDCLPFSKSIMGSFGDTDMIMVKKREREKKKEGFETGQAHTRVPS